MRIFLCLLWLPAAAAGLYAMAIYETTAGDSGKTPLRWPAATGVRRDMSHATLLMFAHPRCPCTRASVEELNRLLTRCGREVTPHILFFTPENAGADWTQTELWRSAQAIPGVIVENDPDGKIAKQFGAETSGYVVLYDSQGNLLYQGGITGGRGHAGDNLGESAIISLLSGGQPAAKNAPVFGCSLLNPERASQPEITTGFPSSISCTK